MFAFLIFSGSARPFPSQRPNITAKVANETHTTGRNIKAAASRDDERTRPARNALAAMVARLPMKPIVSFH
jgi:hypothetical protein